jgi:glycosyltransferase involved in cell wall biosynthesis
MYNISIIVPIYQVEDYIRESVQAMCNQSFDCYEIILVDDETKDKSIDIALEVINKAHVPYQLVRQKNKGLPGARNAGIAVARGRYVCFIDPDDIIHPDYLKCLYELAERECLDVCFCDYQTTTLANRQPKVDMDITSEIIKHEGLLEGFITRSLKIHACSLLVNLDLIHNENLWFNEKLRFGEDNNFMWRLFPLLEKIGHVKAPLYGYLKRGNSIMTTQNSAQFYVMYEVLFKTQKELLEKYPSDAAILQYMAPRIMLGSLRAFCLNSTYKYYIKLLKKIEYKEPVRYMKGFWEKKAKILAIALNISPLAFYLLVRISTFAGRKLKPSL